MSVKKEKTKKKNKPKYTSIGGQALMEGIMMRGPEKSVMCVRRMDGSITTEEVKLKKSGIIKKIPIIRGVVSFASSMALGTKLLMRSADFAIEDEEKKAELEALEAEKAEQEALEAEKAKQEAISAAEAPEAPAADTDPVTDAAPEAAEASPETEAPEAPAADAEPEAAEASPETEAPEAPVTDAAPEAAEASPETEAPEAPAAAKTEAPTPDDSVTQTDANEPEEKNDEKKGKDAKKKESSGTGLLTFFATLLGFGLAILLFFFLPTWGYKGLLMILPENAVSYLTANPAWKSVFEGLIKLVIFVGYMLLCSSMKEVRRLFMYHGAEHKTIFCYEAGEELTVENVRRFKRFHPRCGTSFLIFMLLLGILAGIAVSALLPKGMDNSFWIRPLVKLALIPLIMGFGYELLKFAGKHDNIITRIISAPGLWMQRISTKEPDDSMIECAIAALKPVIPENGEDMQ